MAEVIDETPEELELEDEEEVTTAAPAKKAATKSPAPMPAKRAPAPAKKPPVKPPQPTKKAAPPAAKKAAAKTAGSAKASKNGDLFRPDSAKAKLFAIVSDGKKHDKKELTKACEKLGVQPGLLRWIYITAEENGYRVLREGDTIQVKK